MQQYYSDLEGIPSGFEKAADSPQVLHFKLMKDGNKVRVHLRLDNNGSGTLIINASRIYWLNPTASFMVHQILSGAGSEAIAKELTKAYNMDKALARTEVTKFQLKLDELVFPSGACPIHDLGIETTAPFSANPTAPYRMDLAITYLCNNDCLHCYNVKSREKSELDTKQWFTVLDRLWRIGIPHIVFTGGEPTTKLDLPELIAHAEKNGQITGINTNGRKLSNLEYVQSLAKAGLDHVQITLESSQASIHDKMVNHPGAWQETISGIKNVLSTKLFIMTNTTLLQENSKFLNDHLDFLADLGVPTVGLNALIYSGRGRTAGTGLPESELPALLELAQNKTAANHQRLIWYTPTRYCHFDPMQLQLGVKGCTAALYNMCIEPDGSVIPCQSYYETVGNILTNPWDSIWNHELSKRLRERKYAPSDCRACAMLTECGGGCPLAESASLPQPQRILQGI